MQNMELYPDSEEFDFEGEDEEILSRDCPKCGRSYCEIDYEYQSCSKCGWDAESGKFNENLVREPDEVDFMNGDADLMTGQWL